MYNVTKQIHKIMEFLIVDDIPAKANLVKIILEQFFDGMPIKVTMAKKFHTARTYIEKGDSFRIIFLDGDLKDQYTGVDLIPIIKSKLNLAASEIVMISDNQKLVAKANKLGVTTSLSYMEIEESATIGYEPDKISDILQKLKKEMSFSSH